MKENYQLMLDKELEKITAGGRAPSLLLHACCAPCSSSCLERLKDSFAVTVLFYNPNIEEEEYFKRYREDSGGAGDLYGDGPCG